MVPVENSTPLAAMTSTTPSVPSAMPHHIRGVIRSRPRSPATTATTVGTVARMSELLVALVRARPRMKASW